MLKFKERLSKSNKLKTFTMVMNGSWNISFPLTALVTMIELVKMNAFYTALTVSHGFLLTLLLLLLKVFIMATIGQVFIALVVFAIIGIITLIGRGNANVEKQKEQA